MSERIILTDLDEQMQVAVADTRQRVAELYAELPRWGLVVWTAGNVSERGVVDRGDVGGVPHPLHYATTWAARREPIPYALTMMGDEFGGGIPIGPFALIGDEFGGGIPIGPFALIGDDSIGDLRCPPGRRPSSHGRRGR